MKEEQKKEILNLLQEGIPLIERPFYELARSLAMEEDIFLETVKSLKSEKIIRQISPIFDTQRLGYESSLVAFQISSQNLESAVTLINAHPGVSHNYERNHDLNVWFTLAVPPDSSLGLSKTVEILANRCHAASYAILQSKEVFKIQVKLDMAENSSSEKEEVEIKRGAFEPLSEQEKEIIKATQEDIPLVSEPFVSYSESLKIPVQDLLFHLESFRERGIMRRFAGILNHRKAGFSANGMSVWKIPSTRIMEVGKKLASYKGVSHCYERTTHPQWPYNLFAMIHGQSKEDVEKIVETIAREEDLADYRILYFSKEFKKKRVKYFVDAYYQWESDFQQTS